MADQTTRTKALAIIAHHFGKTHVNANYRFGADLGDDTGEDDMRLHFKELKLELEDGLDVDLPDLEDQLDAIETVDDMLVIVVGCKGAYA